MAGTSPVSKRRKVLALQSAEEGQFEGAGHASDLFDFLSQRGGRTRELELKALDSADRHAKLESDLRAAQTELRITKVRAA